MSKAQLRFGHLEVVARQAEGGPVAAPDVEQHPSKRTKE